ADRAARGLRYGQVDFAFDRAVGIETDHPGAAPAGVPDPAFGIHAGAVGRAAGGAGGHDRAWRADQRGLRVVFGLEDGAGGGVAPVQGAAVAGEADRVGNADAARRQAAQAVRRRVLVHRAGGRMARVLVHRAEHEVAVAVGAAVVAAVAGKGRLDIGQVAQLQRTGGVGIDP